MKYRKIAKSVNCPYYRFDIDVRLVCDGFKMVFDGTEIDVNSINATFLNRDMLLQCRRHLCSRNWEKCPIGQMVAIKREMAEKKWSDEP